MPPATDSTTKDDRTRRPMATSRLMLALLVSALAVSLAACSSSTRGASGSSPSVKSGSTITIDNFAFSPDILKVEPGATVTVENKDSLTHTLTSVSGLFNSGNVPGGSTAHFTAPTKPGMYAYRCSIHQFMTGTLVVSAN